MTQPDPQIMIQVLREQRNRLADSEAAAYALVNALQAENEALKKSQCGCGSPHTPDQALK